MGSVFGSTQTTTTNQSGTAKPWEAQSAPLQKAFAGAGDIYAAQKDDPFYQGDLYAGTNAAQQNAANQMIANGQQQGQAGSGMMVSGQQGVDQFGNYLGNANNFASGNFNQGSNAASGAMAGNTGFAMGQGNAGLSQGLQMAGTDRTASNIASGEAYANNDAVRGMIDSSMTDVRRNLGENVLPGINARAVGTGNMNSSRAGVAEGIANRDAGETAANIAAKIRGQAYTSGLGMAEAGGIANMQGSLAAGNLGNNMAVSGARGEQMGNQLNSQNLTMQQQGNNALGQGVSMGSGMLTAGGQNAAAGGQLGLAGGGLFQQDQQGENMAGLQKWQGDQAQPWAPLNNYYKVVGNKNWGSQTTSKGTSTTADSGNPIGSLAGIAMSAASIF